jgi:uncharacterized protein (DUF1697 family)
VQPQLIQVAGNGVADIRKPHDDLGVAGARPLPESGNVVFKINRRTSAALEGRLSGE